MANLSPRDAVERAARSPGSLALAGLLVAGCADDAPVLPSCQHVVCSTDAASCIKHVAEVVGCQLDQDIINPPVRMLTAAQYLAEGEDSETPLTAEQERALDDHLRMQILLGLMPEGYSREQAGADTLSNFVALYSLERKEIVILTDRASDPHNDYLTLVHEMVHAYQDAAWDLAALNEAHAYTHDRFLGLRALIEGDARFHEILASLELSGRDPLEVDWVSYFIDQQVFSLERAQSTKTPALDVVGLFPYAFGGEFVLNAWQDGGTSRVGDLWRSPPDSVRQVFGGYEAWPAQFPNGDVAFDPQAVAVMPPNYAYLSGSHEGTWLINAMLQRTAGGERWTPALEEISADFLATWRWNDGDVVAMWRIHSEQPDDLVATLTSGESRWVAVAEDDIPTTHLVTTVDTDVVLIAVTSGDARTVLAEIAGWQSPAEAVGDAGAGAIRETSPRRLLARR